MKSKGADLKPPMPQWRVEEGLLPYPQAVAFMEDYAGEIRNSGKPELLWCVEHEPLYTAGRSARKQDLLRSDYPVYETARGGQYTYHGPGQRVIYTMLDLKKRMAETDVRRFVWLLEEWVIRSLAVVNIAGERREGRIGIWVVSPSGKEAKIAAIGIKIRHWVSYHGIAVNIAPDLSHYQGIVPCGIREFGVTSLHQQGCDITMQAFDGILKEQFAKLPW